MDKVSTDIQLYDIFISHSWNDKKEYVDPLVAKLDAMGIKCWYDNFEIIPGDSIPDKINYGLMSSKIVLLCLSDNFFKGTYAPNELSTAIAMSNQNSNKYRIVPLMLTDLATIFDSYQFSLVDKAYIKWDANLDIVTNEIKSVLSKVDESGGKFWREEGLKLFNEEKYIKSVLCTRKGLLCNDKSFGSQILYLASLLKLGYLEEVNTHLLNNNEIIRNSDDDDVDIELLDFVQDTISKDGKNDLFDEYEAKDAIVTIMGTDKNKDRSWKYSARIFDYDNFNIFRDDLLFITFYHGREKAFDWVIKSIEGRIKDKIPESMFNVLCAYADKLPDKLDVILDVCKKLTTNIDAGTRSFALVPLYIYGGDEGREMVIKALKDKSFEARLMAIELLTGELGFVINDDWLPEKVSNNKIDKYLTDEVVMELLHESDEDIFEVLVEHIGDGKIPKPKGFKLSDIKRPPTEEVREAYVKSLKNDLSEENIGILKEYALNDPSDFVRREAIDILEENPSLCSKNFLRKLYNGETVSRVRDAVTKLILEEHQDGLDDVYLNILMESKSDSYSHETAFKCILIGADPDNVNNAINHLVSCRGYNTILKYGKRLIGLDQTDNVTKAFNGALQENNITSQMPLVAGMLPDISTDFIQEMAKIDDERLKINVLRALEYRLKNSIALDEIRSKIEYYWSILDEIHAQRHWETLESIDGILEFSGKEEAIDMLKRFYIKTKDKDYTFPLRAAWERLKILGIIMPHGKFEDSRDTLPSPWPDRSGPFYGIA
jgi:hypothetical protein